MKRTGFVLAGSALVLLLSACDRPGDGSGDGSTARQNFFPAADYVADAAKGDRLFRINCAHCHGPRATGSRQGPPLVNAIYRPAHHADLSFYWAVKDGARQHHWQFGDMPPISGVSAEEVADIIAYVRQEQRKKGIR